MRRALASSRRPGVGTSILRAGSGWGRGARPCRCGAGRGPAAPDLAVRLLLGGLAWDGAPDATALAGQEVADTPDLGRVEDRAVVVPDGDGGVVARIQDHRGHVLGDLE